MKALLLLLVFISAPLSAAQLYRWVDADGKVHYTDQPPDAKAKNVEQRRFGGNVIDTTQLPYATREAAKKFPLTLYANDCGDPCTQAVQHLSQRGVPFVRKTLKDEAEAEELRKLAGGLQVPLLLVGKKPLKYFQAQEWDSALDAAGYPKTAPYMPKHAAKPADKRNPPIEPAKAPVKPGVGADPVKADTPASR